MFLFKKRLSYKKFNRSVTNFEFLKFQDTLNKKIDQSYEQINEKLYESYDLAFDKLIDSFNNLEHRARLKNLQDADISVSVNIGIITIGINKKISNE